MKFLIDVCVGRFVYQWLMDQEHDAVNVADRNPTLSDTDILEWAFKEGRILVTLDKDFQELAFLRGKPHSGIVRLPNVQRQQRIELVKIVLERHAKDLMQGSIITVKQDKIRVSKIKS